MAASSPGDDDTDPAVADTHASSAEDTPAKGRGPRAVRRGDTLGRYELGEELGEGGMATVFRARDKELRRDVAVKVLFPHLARRDEVVHRFHREARAAAGLEHANILRIYDVGGAVGEDPPYIVMEYVRGRSLLAEIEQRGPMLAEVCACVGALLADALAAAHKASIVHRDIKPANVMIAPGGRILLTDFGVARLETEDSLVTKTGALLGTPAYMSPEQASGDTATARSDLYSLGATLYQLATGTLPYTGSPAKMLAQIAAGTMTAPAKKRPAVGPDLSSVIQRLMAPEPEQRLASATAAAAELRAIVTASGLGEPADELAAYFADPDKFVADRTPGIVSRTTAAAKDALADGKLPRALALADRAGALAPEDPAVIALIDEVAEGGRARGRRKVLAVIAVGVLVVGGGAAAGLRVLGGAHGAAADASSGDGMLVAGDGGIVLAAGDGGIVLAAGDGGANANDGGANDGGANDGGANDARGNDARANDGGARDAATDAPVDAAIDAPVDAARPDAGVRIRDAGLFGRDAVIPMTGGDPRDAAAEPARDAAEPALDAAAAMGSIVVKNDTFCEVSIDGVSRGRWYAATAKPYPVTAGHHTVECATDLAHWTHEVDVPPGGTARAEGALQQAYTVTFAVDATVDGVRYRKGATAKLTGRHRVEVGGVPNFVDILSDCRIEADLGCHPNP